MKKFLKEIFSSENLRKATIYALLGQSNITTSDYVSLTNVLRDMNQKILIILLIKKVKLKKLHNFFNMLRAINMNNNIITKKKAL